MQHLCLIVHAGAAIARALDREFPGFGFRPYCVGSVEGGIELLRQWRFDAVLIDVDGSTDDPVATMQKMRRHSSAPISLLAHDPGEASQLAWLEAGARDVMAMPASALLIATKLRRLIETNAGPNGEPTEVSIGTLRMNTWQSSAHVDGKSLPLTALQFELLYMLALRAGQFVDRETITAALRTSGAREGRGADVHVFRIRKKLRELDVRGMRLDTVHGRGYCLSILDATTRTCFASSRNCLTRSVPWRASARMSILLRV